MFVIGTAGHVDHGKSTLVQALTGIDPDRLREEKERGMTIDLGFAWLTLPGGREVSIVDVPGHERFIKNMLAGVGGIDLALLVVAADEGVMPQTREHFAILDLLRVSNGVVAITKCDLVDADWIDLVKDDIAELLEGTLLAEAPMVPVSARTGAGLRDLLDVLDDRLDLAVERTDRGRPRLPIDRVFTIAGFGTVVTGTLIDGSLRAGQEAQIQPSGFETRIRGLQSHRAKVDSIGPGSRVAANLAGLSTEQIRRGDVLTAGGWLNAGSAFDVSLRLLEGLSRPLVHNTPVTFHSGSAEVNAKVRLLDANELKPGESGWAQIRTEQPVALVKGDLFIIRSSNETLGGGEVVDTAARRHRRFQQQTLGRLESLQKGAPDEVLLEALRAAGIVEVQDLFKKAPLSLADASAALKTLIEEGAVHILAGREPSGRAYAIAKTGWDGLVSKARDILVDYHNRHPLRFGMPREELKSRLGLGGRQFGDVLHSLFDAGNLDDHDVSVALAGFRPELAPGQSGAAESYLAGLNADPYSPPTDTRIDPEVVAFLVDRGDAVRANDQVVFSKSAFEAMLAGVKEAVAADGKITVGEFRDRFATTRKYALAFLEYLDEQKITRRSGDDRVLRNF